MQSEQQHLDQRQCDDCGELLKPNVSPRGGKYCAACGYLWDSQDYRHHPKPSDYDI